MRGKVVLITGASSGIGAGTASHFASLGCLLSLTGRNEDRLKETQKSCVQAGCKEEDVLLIPADLLDTNNLSSIVQKTVEKFGRLDVLVNNAGRSKPMQMDKATVEDYNLIMNTNLKSVFFLTQSAMPHLIQSKGSVVNVSSIASQRPVLGSIFYCMSKAALDHFTRIVALDVASKGVRVNAVNPGIIETPMLIKSGFPGMFVQLGAKFHAIGRGGSVEEIAKAITFLADNNQSSFITGITLLAEGGWALLGPM